MTVKVLLSKLREDRNIEFVPVYFSSTTKTMIKLDKWKC